MSSSYIRPIGCVLLTVVVAACSRSETASTTRTAATREPIVSPDGRSVELSEADDKRMTVATATESSIQATLTLPARAAAAAVNAPDLPQPLVLFETTELSSLYSDYMRASVALTRTTRQDRRLRQLLDSGAAAGKDVDDADADLGQAQATVRETEAKLREAGLDLRVLQQLRPGAVLVVADASETRARALTTGLGVSVAFAAFPDKPLRGTVATIGESVDPVTRSVRVGVVLPDPDRRLRPGMFATVLVAVTGMRGVTIPLSAVISADARTFVFVRTAERRYERRAVELGVDDGTNVTVESGLAPGDRVVSGNAILLKGITFGY